MQDYIDGVLDGSIVTGRLERLAVHRHVRDLELAGDRGYYFDPKKALAAIEFSRCCNLFEGEWAGKPIPLRAEQKFIVWCLIGWRQSVDGLRRFRQAQIEVARKWGKSHFAAYLACLFLFFDDPIEHGAQLYVAAPLDIDTPIPTPSGWSTMGELRIGDSVFDEHGNPTVVIGVSEVMTDRPCYLMRFHDGTEIISDAEHRWPVRSVAAGVKNVAGRKKSEWSGKGIALRKNVVVRSTKEIADTLTTNSGYTNHCIEIAGPLQTADADLPIPPYTLGAWLGDGVSRRGSMAFHRSDIEIQSSIIADGFTVSEQYDHQNLLRFTALGLRTKLRENNLLQNKHVPDVYFRASATQRLSLLQGMMDTDGTCTKTGECRFTNRNKRLADAVYELATSLGILANFRETTVTRRPHYVVTFKAPKAIPVFRLTRKWERQRDEHNCRARHRYIESVVEVASRPVRCISVANESHLFLAGRAMVPTHNTKQDQAKLVWNAAHKMIEQSPALRKLAKITPSRLLIELPKYDSTFRPIASDSKTVDGFNPHVVIKDEEHAWREMHRGLADTLASGFGARSQPITITITTYGDDDSLIWIENHDYAVDCLESVIDGNIIDDSWFAFICALDYREEDSQPVVCYACKGESCPWCHGAGVLPIDDPYDETIWRKANPGIGSGAGFTPKIERMREAANVARQRADKQPEFFQKNLNIRVAAKGKVIAPEIWAKSAGELGDLTGVKGYGGIDLGRMNDFAATVMVFPFSEVDDDGQSFIRYESMSKVWTVEERTPEMSKPFIEQWIRDGHLIEHRGNAVDFMLVEESILEWHRDFIIGDWAYDKTFAHQLAQRLTAEGVEMFVFGQSHKFYTEPITELLKILGQTRKVNGIDVPLFKHDGNPCVAWQAGNLIVDRNNRGESMPDKSNGNNKIDVMVALLMAFSECLYHQDEAVDGYYLKNSLALGGGPIH